MAHALPDLMHNAAKAKAAMAVTGSKTDNIVVYIAFSPKN